MPNALYSWQMLARTAACEYVSSALDVVAFAMIEPSRIAKNLRV